MTSEDREKMKIIENTTGESGDINTGTKQSASERRMQYDAFVKRYTTAVSSALQPRPTTPSFQGEAHAGCAFEMTRLVP